MSPSKPRGRKWKRDEAAERVLREYRATEDQVKRRPPPAPKPARPKPVEPEPVGDAIVPGPDWPHRAILGQHAVYHPAPGAIPENRDRPCPSCGTYRLWDPNNEAYGPHTVEQCTWNQEYNERQEAAERHPRLVGPWSMGF